MSARQPFQFPSRQTAETNTSSTPDQANFSPGSDNLLNASRKENLPPDTSSNETRHSFGRNAFKRTEKDARAQAVRPTTQGLGGVRRRTSAETVSSAKVTENAHISRPGTAIPFSQPLQPQPPNLNFASSNAVMAPIPRKASRVAAAFGLRNTSVSDSSPTFKVPFSTATNASSELMTKNQAHTSTSDAQSDAGNIPDEFSQDMGFRPASRANGPQRIPIEQGPNMLNHFRQKLQSPHPGDDAEEHANTPFSPLRHSSKRSRDEEEEELSGYQSGLKRLKGPQDYMNGHHNSRRHTLSPNTSGRPSSGMSHSAAREDHHQVGLQQQSDMYYGQPPDMHQTQRYSSYAAPASMSSQPAPGVLTKLIGMDADDYVAGHMETYDKMVERFETCTMDEWRAGADEIAADYHALLDHVKQYMDTKLKLYSDLHAEMQAHTVVLQERDVALEDARLKLVKDGADVLK